MNSLTGPCGFESGLHDDMCVKLFKLYTSVNKAIITLASKSVCEGQLRLIYIKCLAYFLAHGKHTININPPHHHYQRLDKLAFLMFSDSWSIMDNINIKQALANIFYNGPHSKYFRLRGSLTIFVVYSSLFSFVCIFTML